MVFEGGDDKTAFAKPMDRKIDKIIKIVGCAPGETLIRNDQDEFFCNGVLLGKAIQKDSNGRVLPRFYYDGTVPADSYFMVGDNPRSFDSKYFGFINAEQILFKALPLF